MGRVGRPGLFHPDRARALVAWSHTFHILSATAHSLSLFGVQSAQKTRQKPRQFRTQGIMVSVRCCLAGAKPGCRLMRIVNVQWSSPGETRPTVFRYGTCDPATQLLFFFSPARSFPASCISYLVIGTCIALLHCFPSSALVDRMAPQCRRDAQPARGAGSLLWYVLGQGPSTQAAKSGVCTVAYQEKKPSSRKQNTVHSTSWALRRDDLCAASTSQPPTGRSPSFRVSNLSGMERWIVTRLRRLGLLLLPARNSGGRQTRMAYGLITYTSRPHPSRIPLLDGSSGNSPSSVVRPRFFRTGVQIHNLTSLVSLNCRVRVTWAARLAGSCLVGSMQTCNNEW